MYKRSILLKMIFILIGLMCLRNVQAQFPEIAFQEKDDVPSFYYDVITLATDEAGMSVMRIFTKIAYDELQFVREEDHFRAEYEASITILNQQGDMADGKVFRKQATVSVYEQTNSHIDFSMGGVEFKIRPGTYEISIGIMDLDAKITGRQKTRVVVPDYSISPLDVSDLLLVDYVIADSLGDVVVRPNVLSNYGDTQESLYLWYEIYSKGEIDSVLITYSIEDLKGDEMRWEEHFCILDGKRTVEILEIPRGDLETGRYKLQLLVEAENANVKRKRDFSIRWIGMPAFASDLNKAIDQMKYIAKGDFYKKIRKQKDPEERKRMFMEFWRAVDPIPATNENELMEEYYRRVEYADVNYSGLKAGWKTDRGMVIIVLGPPSEVERRPFDAGNKPYEIWYYFTLNREFVFVDRTGLGEYYLTTPFWDIIR